MVEVNEELTEQTLNDKQSINNDQTTIKEKVCCVCMITEKEATIEGLKFIKMNTIYNKKFDEFLGINLSESQKIKDAHVCSKCVDDTTEIVEKLMKNKKIKEKEEIKEKVDSFTDYILSSSYLFGLDNLIITQACFNMYDAATESLAESDAKLVKYILKNSIIELERKLHELEKLPTDK